MRSKEYYSQWDDAALFVVHNAIRCAKCGKIKILPNHVHNGIAFGEEVMIYTYNCKCGHKQQLNGTEANLVKASP